MGNKAAAQQQSSGVDSSHLHKDYTPAFEECKRNPNFFRQYFSENQKFGSNIGLLFPKASESFEAFFQLAIYLRRDEKNFSINDHAKVTGPKTNIIDRFFIIVLNISLEKYLQKVVSKSELDQLFTEYFKILVKEPKSACIDKLLKHMKIQHEESFNLKTFTDSFRDYHPSAPRFLKQYYASKFKRLEKDGHLLRNFKTRIASDDAVILAFKINKLIGPDIVCLYNTDDYGLSFPTFQKQLVGYTGAWLLLVNHSEKNLNGEKESYILGAFQNGGFRDVTDYQGDMTGFLFSLHPKTSFLLAGRGEDHKYFWFNNISNERFNKRRGLGFGGNDDKKHFKLWIDEELDRGSVYNGKDGTYGFGNLASHGTQKLQIKRLEVWGLGHSFDIENQKNYWKERQIEIMKRRKVDKKQFLSENAGLFFEKTFEHREQVIGEIEKRKEDKEDPK